MQYHIDQIYYLIFRGNLLSPIIQIPIMGGLGNQIFQFCAGKFLELQFGRKVVYNPRLLEGNQFQGKITKRNFEIYEMIDQNSLDLKSIQLPGLKIKSLIAPNIHVWEKDVYDFAIARVTKNTKSVVGYHQHAKMIELIWPEIQEDFAKHAMLRKSLSGNVIEQVAIHIRLSDNLTNPRSIKFHGLTHQSYYFDAIEKLMTETNFPKRIKIYSDTPHLVSDIAEKLQERYNIETLRNTEPNYDFTEMSRSSHLIINNSSFSWWAGWLASKNFEAKVVYPKPWYAKIEHKELPIYVNSWIPVYRNYSTS